MQCHERKKNDFVVGFLLDTERSCETNKNKPTAAILCVALECQDKKRESKCKEIKEIRKLE